MSQSVHNPAGRPGKDSPRVVALSAVTLATADLTRSMRFYAALGFVLRRGALGDPLVSYAAGDACLNLLAQPGPRLAPQWGRVIFYVSDVDAFHAQALARGLQPQGPPRNAEWGERYFHIRDPDGHELSFAQPIPPR